VKKYLVRYVIFWLPAALVAYLFNNSMAASHILLWFTAFFFLLGWGVNTGMAAYRYPRAVLAALLTYTGVHLIVIELLYRQDGRTLLGVLLRRVGGAFSFIPLDMFVKALRQYSPSIPHELYATVLLIAVCLIGYLAGLLRRRSHPDPYHPVMGR
jgi:hypothetical protein